MKRQLLATFCAITLLSLKPVIAQDTLPKLRRDVDTINGALSVSELVAIEDPASVASLQLFDFPEDDETIDDKTLDVLLRFPALRALTLNCIQVTDRGFKHVSKLKQLECLIVYDCQLTDKGLQELKGLSNLKIVGFYETRVTDGGITELKETLKKTYFERYSAARNGTVFDANGCMRPQVVKAHFRVTRLKAE